MSPPLLADSPLTQKPKRKALSAAPAPPVNGVPGRPLRIVILGLSLTSSWGNGHATTYRGLVRELSERGHEVLFLERDVEWYASNRDLPRPPYGRTALYKNIRELKTRFTGPIREADMVIVGSYVMQGASIGEWVTAVAGGVKAFYDIDTPVTIARLAKGDIDYLTRALVSKYDLYLSFTGGPMLQRIQKQFGSPMARPLYCSVDPQVYQPQVRPLRWDLGYMGTYSDDRQPVLHRLLVEPARSWPSGRFIVAGPQYPPDVIWPRNVKRLTHLSPARHSAFYNSQRFTLNVTRAHMVAAGYSPSVRLFEAAACGTPIISDPWEGLETVLTPGREVLISRSPAETLAYLRELPEKERRQIGEAARKRVLAAHTARHRALELESYALSLLRSPN